MALTGVEPTAQVYELDSRDTLGQSFRSSTLAYDNLSQVKPGVVSTLCLRKRQTLFKIKSFFNKNADSLYNFSVPA